MSQSHLHAPTPLQNTRLNERGLDIYHSDASSRNESNNEETIGLTIRFSNSLADLPLSIPLSPSSPPTTATLKQHIRASLPPHLKSNRLRLIHAGKALDDAVPLATSLKRFVPPRSAASAVPSRISTPGPYDSGSGSESDIRNNRRRDAVDIKGKTPIRDPPLQQQKDKESIYVHCSIGDVALTEEELAAEAALASTRTTQHDGGHAQESARDRTTATTSNITAATSNVLPAPRGFDRLLAAGFTASEVHALRLQFVSVQAHTHTPETMPSPNTLRALEDQWLDDSNGSGGLLGSGSGGDSNNNDGSGGGSFDESGRGALDDMIWGTTMGFFWPIGCVIWGTRETGIFSPRRKIAIVIGLILNLGLGFVKWGD